MNLIKILQENRLMKTPQEINIFEETLEKIAKHPNDENLILEREQDAPTGYTVTMYY
ncbi:Imm30 family immunity protein [Okeania sp. SIO2C9]|uniref:Imm30 family immunity protein n=1 Tax=Okeania sp. SIO2C9 TaxID=2607791 RepID=UPI0025FC1630|nr:Imm30 family immunity protein [Okeania sp. SIO2C9]